jgi:hypothetical protein
MLQKGWNTFKIELYLTNVNVSVKGNKLYSGFEL